MTAKHCFQDREGQIATDQPHVIIHRLPENQIVLRPILRAWNSAVADVSVGVAGTIINNKTGERVTNGAMVLSAERPPAGTEVATYAFANTEVRQDEGKISIKLRPDMYAGRLIDYFPNRRDAAMLTWPVYETSMPIHAGASGGPVVSERGNVFAVNTSGVEGATDISYVTPIDFILDAVVENVSLGEGEPVRSVTLRELAELGLVVFRSSVPEAHLTDTGLAIPAPRCGARGRTSEVPPGPTRPRPGPGRQPAKSRAPTLGQPSAAWAVMIPDF